MNAISDRGHYPGLHHRRALNITWGEMAGAAPSTVWRITSTHREWRAAIGGPVDERHNRLVRAYDFILVMLRRVAVAGRRFRYARYKGKCA